MERALARSRDRHQGQRSSRRRIRLMIVDDSMVARAVLSRMIESDDDFEIAAVAGTAEDAIEALHAVHVDVILLDLEMPGAGGLKSIPRILAAAGGARVMIVSSLADDGAEETVAALALGAADTLPKPGIGRFNGRFSEILLRRLKALGYAERQAEAAPQYRQQRLAGALRAMPTDPIDILAIGASTGGIHALGTLFQASAGQDPCADPGHPASAGAVHDRVRAPARRCGQSRGGGCRGRHGAAFPTGSSSPRATRT